MINIITEDHTLLYSSLTMSVDYGMHLQPFVAFSLMALKERGLNELSWASKEYRCCLQQVEAGKSESYKLYVLFVGPRACPSIEASLKCKILFGIIRTVLGPYDLVYRGRDSPLQRISQSRSVLDAIVRRTNCLLSWEPALHWPLPLALPTVHCTLMQTGILFTSFNTILTEAYRDSMNQVCSQGIKTGPLQDITIDIITSTRMVAFLDAYLLDIASCEPNPKGILPRDYLSHANYISMLVHSSLYPKIHSILVDRWGDTCDFFNINAPQQDNSCTFNRFIHTLTKDREDTEDTVEVSKYFSKKYHIMNLTCQGSDVTSIVVQQTLDSHSDHNYEELRAPIFTIFYCVLMTSNLVQQLEQKYQNNLDEFASTVYETLHSFCFPRARDLFPVMFPPLYIQACHPLKAMTSHYLHAITHNKCLAFIVSNHTSKETLTHSVLGLLEEASRFLSPSKTQKNHESPNSEDSCSLDAQIHQMKTGVEAVRDSFMTMFCFRYNCMKAGYKFSIERQAGRTILFWMTYIDISDQISGAPILGKAKTKVSRQDGIPQEIIDYTHPGAYMATCFSVLKTPLHRTSIQDMCDNGTYSFTNGYFSDSDKLVRKSGLLGVGSFGRSSVESTPKRAGSNRRSLLGSSARKAYSLTNSTILDSQSPKQTVDMTKYYESYYQSATLIDMVAIFTSDTALEEATAYIIQVLDKMIQNRYAKGMFL